MIKMKLLVLLTLAAAAMAEVLLEDPKFIPQEPLIREVVPGEDLDNWAQYHFNQTWDALFKVEPNAFVYTYHQSSGQFSGPAFDGGNINVRGCSGQAGSCRNNCGCQCQRSVGPLPRAQYRIGSMQTFKGMPNCYPLSPISGNMCGRSGFLIHGGSCSANPSEGCIVISDANVRYKIKGGGTLNVVC